MDIVNTEIVIPHVQRINSHSKLSDIAKSFSIEAPPVKVTRQRGVQPWEKRLHTEYHMKRMEAYAKSAESPNLTLREIQTGKKDDRTERILLSLYTYFVGVAFLIFLFS